MTKPVNIDKDSWGKILTASAGSSHPIDDDTLRDLAQQRGDDPSATVQVHRQMRADLKKKADDTGGPMPITTSKS